MTVVLQVGDRKITAEEIVPLLAQYQLLPQLLRELVIDQAIASLNCTPEETALTQQRFYHQNQIASDADCQAWCNRQGMTPAQLAALLTRTTKIEKFKQITWESHLESYFLKRKAQLDRVIYSLIRVTDMGVAQELYFRIQAGEQAFADVAREYSQGPEANTGGLIGPVELSTPHRQLAKLLTNSQPGQLCPPVPMGEWLVLVRLERFIPAQLDEAMHQRLLNECFNTWLQEQIQRIQPPSLLISAVGNA